MSGQSYCVIAFASPNTAMTARRALAGTVDTMVMPTPRAISAGCGICLRVPPERLALLRQALAAQGLHEGESHHCYTMQDGAATPCPPAEDGQN